MGLHLEYSGKQERWSVIYSTSMHVSLFYDLTCSGLIRNHSCVIILTVESTHCSSGGVCPRTTARRDNKIAFWTQEGLSEH